MDINNPYFSIIIPTYNRAHLIESTLGSVLNQTFIDYEVIIVDDGSTDNTSQIVREFIELNSLKNFHYYFNENSERAAARNYGIVRAKGQWITFLDSDDLFYPNHLQLAFDLIKTHSELQVIHSAYEFKTDKNEFLRSVKYPKDKNLNQALLKGNLVSCFGMFLRHDITLLFKFNTDRAFSGSEDWLLWLQLAARYKIYFNCNVSGCLVEHNARSVLQFDEGQLLYRAKTLYSLLKSDDVFLKAFGVRAAKRVYGHMLTYTALHLILNKKRKSGSYLFFKGLYYAPIELFSRRSLAIIKHWL